MTHTIDNITSEGLVDTLAFRTQAGVRVAATGTLTMTLSSEHTQIFTGSGSGQIVRLPDATTALVGIRYEIHNNSTSSISLCNAAGTELASIGVGQRAMAVLQVSGTVAGVWSIMLFTSTSTVAPMPICQARRSTDLTVTTSWASVTLDTVDVANYTNIIERSPTVASRVVCKEDGLYMFSYYFTAIDAAGSIDSRLRGRIYKNGTTEIPGSRAAANWGHGPVSGTPSAYLVAGDYVELQMIIEGGSATAVAENPITLTVLKLQGTTGATGATGSGSNIIVKSDGVAIPSTPHSELNFDSGFIVENAGSGIANISLSDYSSFEDFCFVTLSSTSNPNSIVAAVANGGTVTNETANVTNTYSGIALVSTGVTNNGTGRATLDYFNSVNKLRLGTFKFLCEMRVRLPVLSDGTIGYTLQLGLTDGNASGLPTNGVYFSYTHSVNSGGWVALSRSASTSGTPVNTAVVVTADAWYILKVLINAAGTQADYYINNVLVGSSTTLILPRHSELTVRWRSQPVALPLD